MTEERNRKDGEKVEEMIEKYKEENKKEKGQTGKKETEKMEIK